MFSVDKFEEKKPPPNPETSLFRTKIVYIKVLATFDVNAKLLLLLTSYNKVG